ncbi:MAG: aminotransferase class V-fold PLP-dependent enzyme [Halanaerobiales bacterium]|nr:aminotransferase class V-fold PLP-dependent enzyme [Halanaerobiales bacterium]
MLFYGFTNLDKKVGILSINLINLSINRFAHLLQNNYIITIRADLNCAHLIHKGLNTQNKGMVGFSFNYINTEDQINQALNAIEIISK